MPEGIPHVPQAELSSLTCKLPAMTPAARKLLEQTLTLSWTSVVQGAGLGAAETSVGGAGVKVSAQYGATQ